MSLEIGISQVGKEGPECCRPLRKDRDIHSPPLTEDSLGRLLSLNVLSEARW